MCGALGLGFSVALALSAATGDDGNSANRSSELVVESVVVTLIEQVEVPAQESGVVTRICPREGQPVKKGDLLAQINDSQAQLVLQRSKVELANARKQAENRIAGRFAEKSREVADAELQRATDSLQRYPKSISDTEIDRLRLAAQKAALAVEQATFDLEVAQFATQLRQADVDLALDSVERRRVLAPLDGVVVEVNRRAGEWVEASKTMFRVLRLDRLRAEGFVQAKDATEDLVGKAVVLSTTLPGGKAAQYSGNIVFVSPEISAVNGQMRVWAEIENTPMSLRPGSRGSLKITLTGKQVAP